MSKDTKPTTTTPKPRAKKKWVVCVERYSTGDAWYPKGHLLELDGDEADWATKNHWVRPATREEVAEHKETKRQATRTPAEKRG